MKTVNFFFLATFGLFFIGLNAQNVQSNALGTSGGLQAGTTTTGEGYNTFYGYKAGKLNSSGSANTFIGGESGLNNTSGGRNTFIGYSSGNGNDTGEGNTYVGYWGGGERNGSNNTCIGSGAGGESSSGSGNVLIGSYVGWGLSSDNTLMIDNIENDKPLIWGNFAQDQLKFNAKVGVGYGFGNYPTTSGSINVSNYNLFVKGGILTEEVRVSLTNTWADYVFKKDYKLPTLQEVEKQIQEKGHLLNVPSAEEVKNNGIELGEMSKIQQEKIEELTLYIIEQNKINENQNKVIEQLIKRLTKLENK